MKYMWMPSNTHIEIVAQLGFSPPTDIEIILTPTKLGLEYHGVTAWADLIPSALDDVTLMRTSSLFAPVFVRCYHNLIVEFEKFYVLLKEGKVSDRSEESS